MKYTFRSLATPFALALLTGSWSTLMAQQARPKPPANTQSGPVQQRPTQPPSNPPVKQTAAQQFAADPAGLQPKAATEEPISEELESLLRQWELKSALIKSLHGEHKRTEYNLVFEVEKISQGKFFLQTPDKGRIDLVGIKPKRGETSKRIGRSKNAFRLEEGGAEKWICTGKEILVINEAEKNFEILPLPKEAQGENIVHSPLPFLFGMKAEDAKKRYRMTLKSNTKTSATLIVVPRMPSDQLNYAEAWIILEKTNYVPTAVKLFDPSGQVETVYRFDSVEINKVNEKNRFGILNGLFPDKDPFKPDLKNYKMVLKSADGESPDGGQFDSDIAPPINRASKQTRPQEALRTAPGGSNRK